MPEVFDQLVNCLYGIENTIKWARKNNFAELQQRFEEQSKRTNFKIELLKAAEDEDCQSLKDLLDAGAQNNIKELKELLLNTDGKSLLDSSKGNALFTLLNWIKDNLEGNPPHVTLKQMILATNNERNIFDTDFLDWVKENLEPIWPGTIKKLLLKGFSSFRETALSFMLRLGLCPEKFLDWVKRNSEEVLEDLILATNFVGATCLVSIARHIKYPRQVETVNKLLHFLKDYPSILMKLILKASEYGESSLDPIDKVIERSNKNDDTLSAEQFRNMLKSKYDEIASSLLTNDVKTKDFSNSELNVLKNYVKNKYDNDNKEKILRIIENTLLEREKIARNKSISLK